MRKFSKFISTHALVDPPLKGSKFTWSNGQASPVLSRIDRFIFSTDFEAKFPFLSQLAKTRPTSDHIPIVLVLAEPSWGPSPFRLEIMWFNHPSFLQNLNDWWSSFTFSGLASTIFWNKLQALKHRIKIWNKSEFCLIEHKFQLCLHTIDALDGIEADLGTLPTEKFIERAQAKVDFEEAAVQKEISMKQKSRNEWLKAGDRNTHFFHKTAPDRRRANQIKQLFIDGVLVSEKEPIVDHITSFYSNLFTEEIPQRPRIGDVHLPHLSEVDANNLESPITEDEVLIALKNLANDKAPGPDGFPIVFFQKCWSFIKQDFMDMVLEFSSTSYMDRRHNSTFIRLIPKKNHVETVKDYRPISLLTSAYKVIAKVLSSRLQPLMAQLVDPSQSGFISERQIIDGILIANELVDSRLKDKAAGLIYKMDLEKAFDRVSWSFLEDILRKMGFKEKWLSWMKYCYGSPTFSILLNGSPFGNFTASRGLRQGDPLSPLLFVLAIEGLLRMIDKAADIGLFNGFSVKPGSPPISHLHYADDSVFFINPSWEELYNLMSILKCIEAVSGLRVNPSKTKLIEVGEVPDLNQWAANIGCATEALPFSYLGMPLGAKSRAKSLWDSVVEKFDSMLPSWKKGFLTRAGRVTLVKYVLSNLVVYYFSVFLAPVSVIKALEKIMRNFIWDSGGAKKIHLVNWEELCKPIKLGGLGIKSLGMMNKALLAKWVWRFGEESQCLWPRIIRDKYGGPQSIWSPQIRSSPYGCSVWKHITIQAQLVTSFPLISIGDGCTISFWLDKWGPTECMKDMFPALYKIAGLKNGSFRDHVSLDGSSWSFHFKRLLKEAEVNQLASMLVIIGHSPPLLSDQPDSRTWKPTPTGIFSVKSTYNCLMEQIQSPLIPNYPYKTIWNPHVPPKINLFFWTASLNKISTQDSLQRRNFKLAS